MNFNYTENGGKKSFSCQNNPSILYTNDRNKIGVPITKGVEIIKSIKVCPISRWTLIIKKRWKEKLFLLNQSIILYSNEMKMIGVPIIKRMEIIKSIQVCPISQWTLIIRKMVERKAFLAKPKHQYHVSQRDEHD